MRILALLLSLLAAASGAPLHPQPTITSKGLANLTFAETGTRSWVNNFGGGSPSGYFTAWDGKNNPTSATLTDRTIHQTYVWGSAQVSFDVEADKTLRIHGSITNSSAAAVKLNLTLCKIDFPLDTKTDIKADCFYQPGYCSMNASSADIPCWFALSDAGGWSGQLVVGQENWSNNAQYANGLSLEAGKTQAFDFHLDFVSDSADLTAIQTAANTVFAKTYPQTHYTSDLRSLGQIFFVTGTGASGWAADHAKWAKNPRGWLGDPSLDIANKANFKSRMEAFARQCVTNADSIPGVRGFVIWDIEGEQYPHGASVYAGHPSAMPRMAPEMDEIADDLINILKDGGKYEVGFCLRQQQFHDNPGNPEMAFYLASWPQGSDSEEARADLEHEINWCVTRWGSKADIYYVDSNSGNEVNCYTKLATEYPTYLIFPESFTVVTRMYAYEPQYQQARPQDYVRNGPTTQSKYSSVYPNCQSLINLADYPDNPTNVDVVAGGMLRGDIEMVRIWWGGPELPLLQKATTKAQASGWPQIALPQPTPTPQPTATPTPSPSPTPTPTPSPSPTPTPTPSPSPSPSATPLAATYRLWLDQLAGWIKDNPATPDGNQGSQASQYQNWLNRESGWIRQHPAVPDQPK